MVRLGGPATHDLNKMFWDAIAGGRSGSSDSEGVTREMTGGKARQREYLAEVLVEPGASSNLARLRDE